MAETNSNELLAAIEDELLDQRYAEYEYACQQLQNYLLDTHNEDMLWCW